MKLYLVERGIKNKTREPRAAWDASATRNISQFLETTRIERQSEGCLDLRMTPNDYKQGMRHLAGAVSIITTQMDGKPAGMTATAVCSLTAEPPMLLICVNKSATSHAPIHSTGRFTVNCLSSQDLEIAQQFCVGDMANRFQVGGWKRLPGGGIALDSALVTFDCRLVKDVEVSTHTIFIGMVEDVIVFPDRHPLVYVDGQYGEVVAHRQHEAHHGDSRI